MDTRRGSIVFVGNATVLLRYMGFTLLTDPNFLHRGDHAHLGYGLSTRRLTDPAMELRELPPLDLVLLSHYHGDHFDPVVEKELDPRTPIVTSPQAARALARRGFERTFPLPTWESMTIAKGDARLVVTAMPARHGPPVVSALLPETIGSLLDFHAPGGGRMLRLYVTGDTLVHDELRLIPERFPGIDLALLHLGGTRVLGVLVTMDAKQGVEMVRLVDPKTFMPVHYDDYAAFRSPVEDFVRAAREAGLADRMRFLKRGETYAFEVETRRLRP